MLKDLPFKKIIWSLLFMIFFVLKNVAAFKRTDVIKRGTTIGPGFVRKGETGMTTNIEHMLLTCKMVLCPSEAIPCPETHPYAFNDHQSCCEMYMHHDELSILLRGRDPQESCLPEQQVHCKSEYCKDAHSPSNTIYKSDQA